MDVPDSKAYVFRLEEERTLLPGAASSGLMFSDPDPPQVDGPRLLDELIGYVGKLPLTLATQNTLTSLVLIFLGGVIVEGPEPLFPAEKTIAIPAD